MTDPTKPERVCAASEKKRRQDLSDHDAMFDAQDGCVPCKLCGGKAVISDAGLGYGYYVACSNSRNFRDSSGCLINERRLGGWAYNVMEWWNRLHATQPPAAPSTANEGEAVAKLVAMIDAAETQDGTTIWDHSAEEVGLHVMENWQAIRAALTKGTEHV